MIIRYGYNISEGKGYDHPDPEKFNKMLTRHQKVWVFELMILMVVGSFVELLSVSMVLPFINAITNPEKAMKRRC